MENQTTRTDTPARCMRVPNPPVHRAEGHGGTAMLGGN